jgi:hypothetical protein
MPIREKGLKGISPWESRLWSIIGSGNGLSCPLYRGCKFRIAGGWCPNEYMDELIQAVDLEFIDPTGFEFVRNDKHCAVFCLLEKLAEKYLKFFGSFTPRTCDNLISFFEKRNNIEVRFAHLEACHGALWKLQNGWIIYLRAADNPAMKNYILYHEVFHMLAHSQTTPIFDRIHRRGKFNEMLADFFSVSLLLPQKCVKDALKMFHNVDSISANYNVPSPFVYIRLKRMGLM